MSVLAIATSKPSPCSPGCRIGLPATGSGSPRVLLARGDACRGLVLRAVAELEAIDRALDQARERNDLGTWVDLLTRALATPEAQPRRADYLDELAYVYEALGRYDEAIDAMRQALAAGWDGRLDDHPSAKALIADLLLRAGRTMEADDAWREAQRQDPRDPWLYQTAGYAYAATGRHDTALEWQTKGLQLALDTGEDGEMLWLLTGDRAETLDTLQQPPDDLQLRAEEILDRQEQDELARAQQRHRDDHQRPVPAQRASIGAAWFPEREYIRALQLWPSFAADYDHSPYSAYCARLERMLKTLKAQGVARLALTPIAIDDYLTWCAEHDHDPEDPDSRASYAAELVDRNVTRPWPPERNQPCWCGRERKYKKCCQTAA